MFFVILQPKTNWNPFGQALILPTTLHLHILDTGLRAATDLSRNEIRTHNSCISTPQDSSHAYFHFVSHSARHYARNVMTRLTIISFSAGLDSAIMTVRATSVWSAMRLEPSLRSSRRVRLRK